MKLETANSLTSDPATIEDIKKAVADDTRRGEFIILSSQPQHFMQAYGESEPFVLEYRDGGEAKHYQCLQGISREELEAALISYLSGDLIWKTSFRWEKLGRKPWWKLW